MLRCLISNCIINYCLLIPYLFSQVISRVYILLSDLLFPVILPKIISSLCLVSISLLSKACASSVCSPGPSCTVTGTACALSPGLFTSGFGWPWQSNTLNTHRGFCAFLLLFCPSPSPHLEGGVRDKVVCEY